MSDKIENGGMAFPVQVTLGSYIEGMSLRDYFAAHCPHDTAYHIATDTLDEAPRRDNLPFQLPDAKDLIAARWAYADAMLDARNKGGGDGG